MNRSEMPLPQISELVLYLAQSGWTASTPDARFAIWTPPEDPSPDAQTLEDGPLRIVLPPVGALDPEQQVEEAVRALTFYEHRERREVVDDVTRGGSDAVSIKLTPNAPSGEAPLGQLRRAVVAVHDYVLGSAASLHTDSRVLPQRRPAEAEAYADATRISTASGSMIINLALPLANEQDLPTIAMPYGRRVTSRMRLVAQSSTELARLVGSGKAPLSSFGDTQRSTANATELAALAGLSGASTGAPYGLRFSDTPLYRDERTTPLRLRITPAEQDVLQDAAAYLGQHRPQPDVRIRGLVVRLHRQKAYGPGDITVRGSASDDPVEHNYRLNLGENDYNEAARAHPRGLLVSAIGTVHLHGTQRSLRGITGFRVEPDNERSDS